MRAANEDPGVKKLAAFVKDHSPESLERRSVLKDQIATRIKADPVMLALAGVLRKTRDPKMPAQVIAMPEVQSSLRDVAVGSMTDMGLTQEEATRVATRVAPSLLKPWIEIATRVMMDPALQATLVQKLGTVQGLAQDGMLKAKAVGDAYMTRNEASFKTLVAGKPDFDSATAQIHMAALLKDPSVMNLMSAVKSDLKGE